MYFCLRVDLDYVPWDTPDAGEFGHGEPAVLLRLLELTKNTGYKLHFFASNRFLRAFPAGGDAVLGDGHDLDWFCKHPENAGSRHLIAHELFEEIKHVPIGLAIREPWPNEYEPFEGLADYRFLSSPAGFAPPGLVHFPVEARAVREAMRAGMNVRTWTDASKRQLRDAATRRKGTTLVVRPQVLARYDPKLNHIREILDIANAVGMPVRTLRDELKGEQ
ncbi:hypothetical protein BH11ARM2_BH11ARM2_05310 [soil metagenome]